MTTENVHASVETCAQFSESILPSWVGYIVLGDRIHQRDWVHSPQKMFKPMELGI